MKDWCISMDTSISVNPFLLFFTTVNVNVSDSTRYSTADDDGAEFLLVFHEIIR